jgi:hypothetical protein
MDDEAFKNYMETSGRFGEWLSRLEGNDGPETARVAALALMGASVMHLYANYGPDAARVALENGLRSIETAVFASNDPNHPANSTTAN